MPGAFDPTARLGTPSPGRPPRTRRPRSQPAVRRDLARLGPVAQLRAGRLTRRFTQLVVGLVLYGMTMAMVIRATLGNDPWDVLHQGMAKHLPITFGTAVILMSGVVLLGWIPLRQLPGVGTILNSVLIGLSADFFLGAIEVPGSVPGRFALMVAGVFLNAVATALYIGSQLGPGPRDGLMTGLHRRTGISIRLVRTSIEVSVVAVGWMLGGVVGLGTIVYAVAIGPLVQWLLPLAIVELPERRQVPPRAEPAAAVPDPSAAEVAA
ncbi:putative membrane protein YczE [Marmoricola sp. URHA0025 HA25]